MAILSCPAEFDGMKMHPDGKKISSVLASRHNIVFDFWLVRTCLPFDLNVHIMFPGEFALVAGLGSLH